jgi:hypothetical protein
LFLLILPENISFLKNAPTAAVQHWTWSYTWSWMLTLTAFQLKLLNAIVSEKISFWCSCKLYWIWVSLLLLMYLPSCSNNNCKFISILTSYFQDFRHHLGYFQLYSMYNVLQGKLLHVLYKQTTWKGKVLPFALTTGTCSFPLVIKHFYSLHISKFT